MLPRFRSAPKETGAANYSHNVIAFRPAYIYIYAPRRDIVHTDSTTVTAVSVVDF